ncbi:hypothetical protein GCM10011316_22790 [Roseibium aquae]|uniref:EF-hand domain-containing protein n=1 Tax=Roseibium aquae TaxID=1323746 RepID=A0A916X203_9HYPH|nr:EF-hand domain-containing protein [Roseibium aquae]GGB50132.1 hypothetical protein GCM10011316_22790 [Roseibium aquae]
MNKLATVSLAVVALSLAGTGILGGVSAHAGDRAGWQEGGGPGQHRMMRGGPGGDRHMQRLFDRFDVNADGSISSAEIEEASAANFAGADTDGNGSLSLDEMKAGFLEQSADARIRAFQRLDRDGDGTVTRAEYDRVSDRMFARFERRGQGAMKPGQGPDEGKGQGQGLGQGQRMGEGRRAETGDRGNGGSRFGDDGRRAGPMRMMVELLDQNGDGRVTREEFDAVRGELFAAADANGSGSFALEDFAPAWLAINDSRVVAMFQRLDENGDLAISPEERSTQAARMMSRLDSNGDGVVTRADFKGGKNGRHHGKQGGQRG